MGQMRILGSSAYLERLGLPEEVKITAGDTVITFPDEVDAKPQRGMVSQEVAQHVFTNLMRVHRFAAFETGEEGGQQTREFKPKDEMLLVPPMAGG